ncbi:MAG: M20/M25/M40 family metallo-hydrolase [Acidimicrobiia bacterium]|nr:M20/M25/M40 family metallo-hydrolase [Acidimicrobiia bacterium]
MPFRTDNALVRAAAVVQRLADYSSTPRTHELWRHHVATLDADEETRDRLMDPASVDDALRDMGDAATARHLHACSHTTFSPNMIDGSIKTNVIPDQIHVEVDIRTLPGEDDHAVSQHLRTALGDLADHVEVEALLTAAPSSSRIDTPLWASIERVVGSTFPQVRLVPNLHMGFTDARTFRERGSIAYGAGLFSPAIDGSEFLRRFHGHDERVDVESLRLTTDLWLAVIRDMLG